MGPQWGKQFSHVFIKEKYFKNLMNNHLARKEQLYMKAM
jgi:hypothetical protein